MWGLKITGVTYEFDTEGYTKALKKNIETQVHLAAKDFATTALSKIPIRTGFVAGSFGTLTDLIGSGARFNPIVRFTRRLLSAARNFLSSESKPKKAIVEYYYPPGGGKILKTSTSGQQFATKKADIFKWIGDTFIFTYAVDISYFRINDSVPGHAPTAPWGAFLAAQAAFEARLSKAGINFDIRLESFLTPKSI